MDITHEPPRNLAWAGLSMFLVLWDGVKSPTTTNTTTADHHCRVAKYLDYNVVNNDERFECLHFIGGW